MLAPRGFILPLALTVSLTSKIGAAIRRPELHHAVATSAFLLLDINLLAIRRRFCAVAASKNSSCAPLSPRSRSRSSLRIRFR
jgi:hypothetical protein